MRNTYSRLFTLIRDLRILTECNTKPYFKIQSERSVVLVDIFVFSFVFLHYIFPQLFFPLHSIYEHHFEFLDSDSTITATWSRLRCVLATIFIFISRLIAITLVTLEQKKSHQLMKSFFLSPATTHFPLKTYRRSVIIFKIALELRHYPIYRKSICAKEFIWCYRKIPKTGPSMYKPFQI